MYTYRLTHSIIETLAPKYLRRPNDEVLENIPRRNAANGMPGCMGAIDRTHWTWARFPKTPIGKFKDTNQKFSVVIETVCEEDLYIWHMFAACAGTSNDKNVLAATPLMLDVSDGEWPPRMYKITLNGGSRRFSYNAADQGDPQYHMIP